MRTSFRSWADAKKRSIKGENRGTPGGIRTPNLLIRSYLLELKLMRFPQFNRVPRYQEESGNVTNVGDVTDISTDIDGKARDNVCQTGS